MEPREEPTENQLRTINNKEDNNKKDITNIKPVILFEYFWDAYGKKKDKKNAEGAYRRALKRGITHEIIMEGVKKYVNDRMIKKTELRFVKHAATWLNGECWSDEYEPLQLVKTAKRVYADDRETLHLRDL